MKFLPMLLILGLSLSTQLTVSCWADASSQKKPVRSISLVGRNSVTVTQPQVYLGDLAEVTSAQLVSGKIDEDIIALKRIVIQTSPQPGRDLVLSANEVLDVMRKAGVNFDRVGYSLPRVLKVRRASRTLTREEVQSAIDRYIKESGKDIQIRSLQYAEDIQVLPGPVGLEVDSFSVPQHGRTGFRIGAKSEGATQIKFEVSADIDQWIQIPVARHPLARGNLVHSDDLAMARINLSMIPKDAFQDQASLIGLETQDEIGYGELFRRGKLVTPTLVSAGSRVNMIYKSGLIEISASGVALEAAGMGQEIKVRNEASKKVVAGVVIDAGIVEVKP